MADEQPLGVAGIAIVSWGVVGVLALLAQAMWRLTPYALELLQHHQMAAWQWAIVIAWSAVMAFAEGYHGFQKRFSPRVVARAWHLARHPRPIHVVFAPMFCMALFHARRKNLVLAWGVLSLVIVLVIGVRQLAQPWRGMVDVGVVIGLAWGAISIIVLFIRALGFGVVPHHDSLPDPST